jgi:hypothetical protein
MTIDKKQHSFSELNKLKDQIVKRDFEISSLSSLEIKDLLEILDWSKEREKKVIIDLCRIISVRGDTKIITGE